MRRLRWLTDRIGRRGAVLLILGIVWIVYGYTIGTVPHAVGALGILDKIPTAVWAAMWIGCGAVAAGHCGVTRAHDGRGFTLLAIPPAVWAFGLWWAEVTYLAGVGGTPYSWAAAIIWTGLAALVVIVAGWVEPPR